MAAVNKNKAQPGGPAVGGNFRPAHNGHHRILEAGRFNGFSKFSEGIDLTGARIKQLGIKILLAGLLLF